jgi:methyltransferase (TIGR00027 family)
MIAGQPSQTMVQTALLRAAHQLLDEPRIFDDPIAVDLVPEASRDAILRAEPKYRTPILSGRRAHVVLRSRFAEDRLAAAAVRGVRQYVIAAAGLDTFPWRQPGFARQMRIFVADLPESLAVLQDCVRRRGLPQPANLTYVPVDLEHKDLLTPLVAAGFDPRLPAFCSALGIVQFLTLEAVDALLTFAATRGKESEIVFSFTPPDDELNERDLKRVQESQGRTQGYGEPWLTRLRPGQLTARLSLLGFSDIELLTPDLANQRYCHGRSDGLASTSSGQVMAAAV